LLDTGTIVAGYRVDGLLDEGSMGAVYCATQLSLSRTVALKVLSPEFGEDPGFRERFRREGQLQAALDHPHIVTVYEAGETEHGLFLAMRLIQGPTLKEMIVSEELDADRSLAILGSVAEALDSAHEIGLIHRDVKPQNILVGAHDHAYLADFGLTKAAGEASLTATGQFVGTIDYVAPEQVQGGDANVRSDVYSLTGVFHECLTGAVPFPRTTEAAVLYAHISDPPPKVSDQRPDLPEALDEVIAKGMAKHPEERYATASELLREAAVALGKSPGAVT
jgi:serine/threonine protein kinase